MRTLLLAAGLSFFASVSLADDPPPASDDFFEQRIRPLLVERCFECHGEGQMKGGLSLDSEDSLKKGGDSGAVVEPGKPEASLLIEAIGHAGDLKMPPKQKLSNREIADLTAWVKAGAAWPRVAAPVSPPQKPFEITAEQRQFWSFQPIRDVPPPTVKPLDLVQRPLDAFIVAKLEAQTLAAVPPADRRTWLRRVTFDLTGLPPTPDEAAAFLADDSPAAHERVVDRLLASPRFGERWARMWLDVARYAEDQAHTFDARSYPEGFRYRDWVVRAFNADLPFDRFVTEQIAGDQVEPRPGENQSDRLIALGYFALGPVYYADAGCAFKASLDELDDRVDTLSRGFLGLTVACARCHDHKFDPIPQTDYYALAGIFQSTAYKEHPLAPPEVVAVYEQAQAKLKEREQAAADFVQSRARAVAEKDAPRIADYITAAWKLRHPPAGQTLAAADLSKSLDLKPAVLERWIKFLAKDSESTATAAGPQKENVEIAETGKNAETGKKPVSLSPVFGGEGRGEGAEQSQTLLAGQPEKPADEPPLKLVRKALALEGAAPPAELTAAATAYQSQILDALAARDRLEQDHAAKLAAAPEAERSKIAKPELAREQAELLKALFEERGPLAVKKDDAEQLLDDAAKQELAKLREQIEIAKKASPQKYPQAHSLTDGQVKDMKLHIRGNPQKTAGEIPRAFLSILAPRPSPLAPGISGRRELAQAIASPDNPLTARVIVNRIWQQYFGRGIVRTPSNFGSLGERPTHPDLLDHLASGLIRHNWSLKWLHREIVLSATYGRASRTSELPPGQLVRNMQQDPDNQWLWRMPRRRLDVEAWRDAMLSVSGTLDPQLGGPSEDLAEPSNRRRTLYGKISRHNLDPLLRLFDFPDPNITSDQRPVTTVPLQQLFVLNSEFLEGQAKSLATRAKSLGENDSERLRSLIDLLYSRPATDAELALARQFFEDASTSSDASGTWEQYTQAMLAASEFAFVD